MLTKNNGPPLVNHNQASEYIAYLVPIPFHKSGKQNKAQCYVIIFWLMSATELKTLLCKASIGQILQSIGALKYKDILILSLYTISVRKYERSQKHVISSKYANEPSIILAKILVFLLYRG